MNSQKIMKHALASLLCLSSVCAIANEALDTTFFGRVDVTEAPRVEVTRSRPVQAIAGPATAAPIYLHVKPGQAERWSAHCRAYDACSVPVLFVKENWYRNVYLPQVGRNDGREQHYRDLVRLERDERGQRHRNDEE